MSSISASGIGQSVLQYLQQLTTESPSATTDAAATTTDPTTTATQSTAHQHHHHSGSKIKEIQDAVTSALQTAKENGDSTDPNKLIQTAIEQILGGANNVSPTTTPTTTSTQSAFAQTLQSYGVDPQQFRNDFLSAVKDAQNGQVNAANIFGNFPTGTQVDTTG